MKKYVLISFFVFISASLLAQTGKRVAIGLTVGPSIDWLSPKTEGYEGDGASLGLRYGIPVDINFTSADNYYFSTGIKFEHTGGKLAFPFISDATKNKVNLSRKYNALYLTIPTGIKLKTPNFGNFVFAGNFGFLHGFKLSCKTKDTWTDENGHKVIPDQKEEYKNCAFFKESIFVGLGGEYVIRDSFRASLYINYAYTMTNFFANKAVNPVNNLKEKGTLGTVEFLFGIHF